MTFGDYVRMVRTYWRSLLLTIAIGIGAALGLSFALTPQYTATAEVLFTPVSHTASGQDLAFALQYTQTRMVTYQGLATTPQVLGSVVSGLDLDQTPTQLADHVSAQVQPSSTLLTIKAEDPSATDAERIARAVAQSLVNAVAQFEQQQDTATGKDSSPEARVSGRLVTDPARPSSPSSPDFQLNIAAGALLGLILGVAQAAVRFLRVRYGVARPPRVRTRRTRGRKRPPAEPESEPESGSVSVWDGDPTTEPATGPATGPASGPASGEARAVSAEDGPDALRATPAAVPPRKAKPKSQKRPGRRTRR